MTAAEAIRACEHAVVTAHRTPDGDAVGAALALGMALKKLDKDVKVVLEGHNERFDIIPGRELLHVGELDELSPDTFFALDCGSEARIGAAAVFLEKAAQTVNIDHHMSNSFFGQINHVDAEASSTCEIVFRILDEMSLLDSDIAGALYAGIVYDTGGLRHSSTSLETMAIASRLMAFDIPFSQIYNELMHTHSLAEAKALARAVENMKFYENGAVVCSYIGIGDLADTGAVISDLGDICEYISNTAGAQIGVFIYERADGKGVKLSMRSKSVPINEVCQMFGGGGHQLAAGSDFSGTIGQAREAVLEQLRLLL